MSHVETMPVGVCSSRDKTSFEKSVVETGDIADGRTVDLTTLHWLCEWSWVESDTPAWAIGVIYILLSEYYR